VNVMRIAVAVLLGFLLSGCILESERPQFSNDGDHTLLESFGKSFALEALQQDGTWTREKGVYAIAKKPSRYEILKSGELNSIDLWTLKLAKNKWLLQMGETSRSAALKIKPVVFMIATPAKATFLLQPFSCDELKAAGVAAKQGVTYSGSDCKLSKTLQTKEWLALAAKLAPAKLRAVKAE
jgi:hypothetical protein